MTDQDDEPQEPHVPVVEAGRRAAQRAVAVGPLGQVLSQEAGRELADRVADAVMAATLPMAEGLRLYAPGADDAGQPVHWAVHNAMHKRAVDAGDKVTRARRLAKRWEVKRLHGDAAAELRDVLGDDGAKAEETDTVDLFTRIHRALTTEHYRRARAKITASPEQHSAAMTRVALTTLGLPVPGPESVRTVIQEATEEPNVHREAMDTERVDFIARRLHRRSNLHTRGAVQDWDDLSEDDRERWKREAEDIVRSVQRRLTREDFKALRSRTPEAVEEPAGDLLGTPPTYGLVSARRLTPRERSLPAVPGIQGFVLSGGGNRVWLACCYATDVDQCSWQTRFPLYDSPAVDLTTAVGAAQEHRAEHAGSGFVLDQSFPEDMIPENVRGFALASFGDNVRLICTRDGCLWSSLRTMGDALDDAVRQAQGHREMCGSE